MLQLGRCPALFQKLRQRCAELCSCSLGTVSKETGSLSCREWLMLRSSRSGRDRRNGPHLFLQGGLEAWKGKAGATTNREVRGFPMPCPLDPCFEQGRGRQAARNMLSASARYGIHHSDRPWPWAAWEGYLWHAAPACRRASAPLPGPRCNHGVAQPQLSLPASASPHKWIQPLVTAPSFMQVVSGKPR